MKNSSFFDRVNVFNLDKIMGMSLIRIKGKSYKTTFEQT